MSNDENQRDEKGRFVHGNTLWKKEGKKTKELRWLRHQCRIGVANAVYKFMQSKKEFEDYPEENLTAIDAILRKACSEGKYGFFQHCMDHAMGRPITPVVTAGETKATPKTIIKRFDGSTVEYTLEVDNGDENGLEELKSE